MNHRTVVVGIPTFNEVSTIASVVHDVDVGLQALGDGISAYIVNADNSSTDGTASRFAETSTRTPKHNIVTPYRAGKGANLFRILQFAVSRQADVILFVDSDLPAIHPHWIRQLLQPILNGLDAAFLVRPPRWDGGDLTYHLTYPLLAGFVGVEIPQPISGEFAVSVKIALQLLQEVWPPAAFRFGVDIWMAFPCAAASYVNINDSTFRRNPLRSFELEDGSMSVGTKFREVLVAARARCRQCLTGAPPKSPLREHALDITSWRLNPVMLDGEIRDVGHEVTRRLQALRPALPHGYQNAARLVLASGTGSVSWHAWEDLLIQWILAKEEVDPIFLETFLLARTVGFALENDGRSDWYLAVREQALSMFRRRHETWARSARMLQ